MRERGKAKLVNKFAKKIFETKFVFLSFLRILKSEYANFFTELFPKIQRIE